MAFFAPLLYHAGVNPTNLKSVLTNPNGESYVVVFIAEDATALAKGNSISTNSAINAFQHAHVSAEIAFKYGTETAAVLGGLKEEASAHNLYDTFYIGTADEYKDEYNNELGRRASDWLNNWLDQEASQSRYYTEAEKEAFIDDLVTDSYNSGAMLHDLSNDPRTSGFTNQGSTYQDPAADVTWTAPSSSWQGSASPRDYSDLDSFGENPIGFLLGLPEDVVQAAKDLGDNSRDDFFQILDGLTDGYVKLLPPWLQLAIAGFNLGKSISSPLVIDLDQDGLDITSLSASTTETFFDLTVDGFAEQTAWLEADQDGFLAIDVNDNGIIDDASELFGTSTVDGFASLAALDSNGDLVIDSNDAQFADLLVWTDINGNAATNDGELQSLAYHNIESISLSDTEAVGTQLNGNFVSHQSTIKYTNGTSGTISDVWFSYDQTNTKYIEDYSFEFDTLFLPTLRGFGNLPDLHVAASENSSLFTDLESFSDNWSSSDFATNSIDSDITDILYQWAGVDSISTDSRGDYIGDARRLEFLEKLLGDNFVQKGQYSDPFQNASAELNKAYEIVFNALKAQLIFQAGAYELFDYETRYSISSGDFEGPKDLVAAEVNALVAESTASGVDTEAFWVYTMQFITEVKSFDDLTSAEETILDTAINNSDSSLSFQSIKDSVLQTVTTGSDINGSASGELLTGTLNPETIDADGGDDTIYANGGDDIIYGDAGDDVIYAEDGDDDVEGGTGDDTIYGGDGHDFLKGEADNDVISAGEGSDTVYGGYGNDTYVYTGGDDFYFDHGGTLETLKLPSGIVFGDLEFSRTGDKNLFIKVGDLGTIEIDRQLDDSGHKFEQIEFDNGTIFDFSTLNNLETYGTDGDDTLNGISSGASSNDVIYGLAGNDTINASSGNDTVDGGLGNDVINTSAGDDTVIASSGFDVVNEYAGGIDTILIPEAYDASDVSIFRHVSDLNDVQIHITGLGQIQLNNFFYASDNATETISFANGVDSAIDLVNYTYKIVGTNGNDTISAHSNYNDDDIYVFGKGDDVVTEYDGTDTILFGGDLELSDLTIYKQDLGTIYNSRNHLVVEDADGNSLTVKQHFDPSFNNGGYAVEKLEFNDSTVFNINTLEIEVRGDANNNSLTGIENLDASNDDVMYAYAGDDSASGYTGNDTIYGGDGNDTLNGNEGDDTLYGEGDDDLLRGLADDDVLDGGAGNDTLEGGTGSDTLDGGAGVDIVKGEDGDDTLQYTFLDNTSERDTYNGGKGADTLNVYLTTAQYSVPLYDDLEDFRTFITNNYSTTTASGDFYNFEFLGLSASNIEQLNVYVDSVLTTTAPSDTPTAAEARDDEFVGLENQNIVGNLLSDNGNGQDFDFNGDTLTVTAETKSTTQGGSVTISSDGSFTYTPDTDFQGTDSFTYTVTDNVTGSDTGSVTLEISDIPPASQQSGSSSAETIYGTSDSDIFDSLAGNDDQYGYAGNDIYIWDVGYGNDRIFDSAGTGDKVSFASGITIEDVRLWDPNNGDLQVHIGSEYITINDHFDNSGEEIESIVFANGATIDLLNDLAFKGTSSSGETIYGRANDDNVITGYEGADYLYGYSGDDTYIWKVGHGNDKVYDSAGTSDTVLFDESVDASDIRLWNPNNGDLQVHIGSEYITINDHFDNSGEEVETATLSDGSQIDLLNNLTFTGTSGAETVYGRAYNEVLVGLEGNDDLYGYGGNDTYVWNLGDGNDRFYDAAGTDDKIILGAGIASEDIRFWNPNNGNLELYIGSEYIRINDHLDGSGEEIETIELSDGTEIDITSNYTFEGTSSGETIYGLSSNEVLIGHGGNDYIYGYGGDDTYIWNVGDGNDRLYDSAGSNDKIEIGAGISANDIRFWNPNDGNLILHLGSEYLIINDHFDNSGEEIETAVLFDGTVLDLLNNLTFEGTDAVETINALSGDETIDGHEGGDYLYGHGGNDTYIWNTGDGNDKIYDSAGTADTIQLGLGIDAGDLRFWNTNGGNLEIRIDTETITINDHFDGTNEEIETITFADGSTLDLLNNLTFQGTSSAETVYGFSDDNILIGHEGADDLYGQSGDDTYIWSTGDGNDRIFDSYGSSDALQLGTGITANDVRFWNPNNGNLELYIGSAKITINDHFDGTNEEIESLVFDDTSSIALTGTLTFSGTASGETIYGTTGSDVLYGLAGADDLYGQGGGDIFAYNASDTGASDRIFNFSTTNGDAIDISDVLDGYDPLTDALSDFVDVTTDGTHSYINVDADGGADAFVQIAQIYQVSSLDDADTLETNGNLITV